MQPSAFGTRGEDSPLVGYGTPNSAPSPAAFPSAMDFGNDGPGLSINSSHTFCRTAFPAASTNRTSADSHGANFTSTGLPPAAFADRSAMAPTAFFAAMSRFTTEAVSTLARI